METQSKSGTDKRWLIIIVAIIAAAAVAIVLIVTGRGPAETKNVSAALDANGMPVLGYATGVTALDEDSLQAAVDEMAAGMAKGYFTTEFKNDAYSTDGQTFECYIGNSNLNAYDMFFQILDEADEQLFLSGILPVSTALREITLDRVLDPGVHTVTVVYTQVEGELEDMTIVGQVGVTMNFHVME